MGKHTNWKDSEAKAFIIKGFESGKLDPHNLPNLKGLKESNPRLFAQFPQKNFTNNVKNIAAKYREKFTHKRKRTKMDTDGKCSIFIYFSLATKISLKSFFF